MKNSKIQFLYILGLLLLVSFLMIFGLVESGSLVSAETNISPINVSPYYNDVDPPPVGVGPATSTFWGWNEVIGWIDFHNTDSVVMRNRSLEGYASSSIGDISFDCEHSPIGNICDEMAPGGSGQADYKVENSGSRLYGWAWNDLIGWIAFCGGQGTSTCPTVFPSYPFQVNLGYAINTQEPPSDFHNYAWNDLIGWISLNCSDYFGCNTADYRVRTSWFVTSTVGYLDSSTFDTEVIDGASFNSIAWDGVMPSETGVSFQLATSNCPGGYVDPPACVTEPVPGDPSSLWGANQFFGPSGSSADSFDFESGDDKSDFDKEHAKYFFAFLGDPNKHFGRYFRYRAWLYSNLDSTLSPRVDEVIINWSS